MALVNLQQNKQRGIVLLTALIMILAVTMIAITLMSSSSIDIKITNAAQEREVAENELIGEVQRMIAKETSLGGASRFLYSQAEVPESGMNLAENTKMPSVMINLNKGIQSLECPRRFNFTAGISCNMLQVTTSIEYGSKSKHELSVVTAIAQEMTTANKGI
ncbi:pilus assembly protein PilX [Pseudoalteromonas sp. MMG010]|uniref:pilus assembly PilX family protein n=1 Tax=Pseudoalteromonas sp. MMG010 TaxID=2822685 RepID=UPI001B3A69B5|nr:pilus assembly protein PilX [Pseudoalteromonas sp. MMG010]MBQ4833061.1 pilus assembly protein PilX [Pseudoalteromonas sp. MMG010]